VSNDTRLSSDWQQVGAQFKNGVHFAPASAIAQNTHTTLAWPLLNFEKYASLVFKTALKIRVSLVRFQSRPPNNKRSKGNPAAFFLA
jgi:hypothetical protein